mmetsp:Transcript_12501/g.29555  ORF Transcript_12501/g.29555 Transcript_12501/m.29555 type:complete len:601 (+) Transcript_12501:125-1927(+)|eukprot:CAMPEP_0181405286 /NCGR_PEP_ID=MMETSP1110-20121109/4682_1 /TAXON_ID=174948 /ORGANISM="Symbiodinium sp., Strain CCMP421" /LENGTH=600 /DNA_ID=CAMNT_0023527671 /DNA_START=127 /DNA_END=1929 /DNA_ORIENTATION=+
MCKTNEAPGPDGFQPDLEHFIRRGYLVIPSTTLPEVNEAIRSKAEAIANIGPEATVLLGDDCLPAIPELMNVLEAAPLQAAMKAVLGEDYLLHGHRHLHLSSLQEQMWHKDSYWGFRRMRHHRPRWCMMLYYPQETTLEMGPTHVLAGTQYWTVDTEGWRQGEDILADSTGDVSMFVEGSSAERQQKLNEAEQQLLGPSSSRVAALAEDVSLTVPAGSCVLMHYDLFHRAGFRAKEDAPTRFMFKFQFIRTRDPAVVPSPPGDFRYPWPESPHRLSSLLASKMELEADDGSAANPEDFCKRRRQFRHCDESPDVHIADEARSAWEELGPVLADVREWLQGLPHPCETCPESSEEASPEVEKGLEVLRAAGAGLGSDEDMERSHDEVQLVAAAYKLGRSVDRTWLALLCALTGGSEAVARAAAYGLAAAGPRATPALLPLLKHATLRVRILAVFALGESARPSHDALAVIEEAISAAPPWSMETANLLQALSCLSARARALGETGLCQRCLEIVLPFLLPSSGHNLVCENACLVALQAGELTGEMGKMVRHALDRIADRSADPYSVCFATEILRRQTWPERPMLDERSELLEPEGFLLAIA